MKAIESIEGIKGKTIKDTYLNNFYLVITFTDDTYLMLETEDHGVYLRLIEAGPIENLIAPMYLGKVEYYPEYIRKLLEMGVVTENWETIGRLKKLYEEAQYQQYLSLKKKYEGDSK